MYINNPGHMTKMVAMPIYDKTLQKSSSPEPADRYQRNLACHEASMSKVLQYV